MILTTIKETTKIISEQLPFSMLEEYLTDEQIMRLLVDFESNLLPLTVSDVRVEKVYKCRATIYIEPETPAWSFVTYISRNEYKAFVNNFHNSLIKLELI